MLQINHVCKRYGKLLACDNIDFRVENGQVALLLGPNGAGKSTIIKCIAGLLRFGGEVMIDGFDNHSLEAKRRLGYVPELPAVYELLTVWEHMEFISRAYRLTDWEARAQTLLETFELYDKREKLGKELSKGMQQKVSLCTALLPSPSVLILDEPMVGLDPHAIKALKNTIAQLREGGASVLISTHMLDSVDESWDVAHIMMNGQFRVTRLHDDPGTGGKTLEQVFFDITEGGGVSS